MIASQLNPIDKGRVIYTRQQPKLYVLEVKAWPWQTGKVYLISNRHRTSIHNITHSKMTKKLLATKKKKGKDE